MTPTARIITDALHNIYCKHTACFFGVFLIQLLQIPDVFHWNRRHYICKCIVWNIFHTLIARHIENLYRIKQKGQWQTGSTKQMACRRGLHTPVWTLSHLKPSLNPSFLRIVILGLRSAFPCNTLMYYLLFCIIICIICYMWAE